MYCCMDYPLENYFQGYVGAGNVQKCMQEGYLWSMWGRPGGAVLVNKREGEGERAKVEQQGKTKMSLVGNAAERMKLVINLGKK